MWQPVSGSIELAAIRMGHRAAGSLRGADFQGGLNGRLRRRDVSGERIDTTASTAWRRMATRAYRRIKGGEIPVGLMVRDTEAAMEEARLFVHGIRRDGEAVNFDDATVLRRPAKRRRLRSQRGLAPESEGGLGDPSGELLRCLL